MGVLTRAEALALIDAPLAELCARAANLRDQIWGKRLTYSRKVFVPLTNMCRDTCKYCTFVQHPDAPGARIMKPDEVLTQVRAGAAQGCKEVLFSLGEKPELRYPQVRAALALLGYASMIDYLRDMCARVVAETGLLPHVNAGTLSAADIAVLKPVSASMGMMLETISTRLMKPGQAHHGCPDKHPKARLQTLEITGQQGVPFTTGLLIGIGETWAERVDSVIAIADAHRRHGHIQEVIVQNFQRKPDIAMAQHPEPTLDDMLRTLAMARLLLPVEISLQAPPNLAANYPHYIGAGINDWGGISPVTIDYINPGHPWPQIDQLRAAGELLGYALQERLTIYPRYQQRSAFLHPALRAPLGRLVRADGLAHSQCGASAAATEELRA